VKNPATVTVPPGATRAVMPAETAPAGADRRTRDRVSQLLLERGQATAAELAEVLGLGVAAIRRHLDAMLADGDVTA
jgi:predicted ArsR family transcriptional regulator